MSKLILKLAVLATDYDVSGVYRKADRVDHLLFLLATANLELQRLEFELLNGVDDA